MRVIAQNQKVSDCWQGSKNLQATRYGAALGSVLLQMLGLTGAGGITVQEVKDAVRSCLTENRIEDADISAIANQYFMSLFITGDPEDVKMIAANNVIQQLLQHKETMQKIMEKKMKDDRESWWGKTEAHAFFAWRKVVAMLFTATVVKYTSNGQLQGDGPAVLRQVATDAFRKLVEFHPAYMKFRISHLRILVTREKLHDDFTWKEYKMTGGQAESLHDYVQHLSRDAAAFMKLEELRDVNEIDHSRIPEYVPLFFSQHSLRRRNPEEVNHMQTRPTYAYMCRLSIWWGHKKDGGTEEIVWFRV